MGKASEVKQYSRIIYAVDGEEYSAVALSVPTVGYHSGNRQASRYVNLVYLDEQGQTIKVMGAPLATAAASPEELTDFARLTIEHRFGKPRTDQDVATQAAAFAQERQRVAKEVRTTSWRPMDAQGVAPSKESLVEEFLRLLRDPIIRAYIDDYSNMAAIYDAMGKLPEPEYAPSASVPVEGTIGDGKPSAEDLDAVVHEETVAAQTAAPKDYEQHELVNERNAGIPAYVPPAEDLPEPIVPKVENLFPDAHQGTLVPEGGDFGEGKGPDPAPADTLPESQPTSTESVAASSEEPHEKHHLLHEIEHAVGDAVGEAFDSRQ